VVSVELFISFLVILAMICLYGAVKISKKQKPVRKPEDKPIYRYQPREYKYECDKYHKPVKSYPDGFNYAKINITTKKARKEYGNFTVFDLETTGLNPTTDSIIEIGAVKVSNGRITDSFSMLVDPGHCIPPDATKINGITDEMVKGAPGISEVLPAFMRFAGDDVLVAHNAYSFDIKFLLAAAYDIGIGINNPIVDTLPLCRKLYPDFKNHKLGTVARELCIEMENAHRSLCDATATAQIFIKCLDKLNKMDEIKARERKLAREAEKAKSTL
jgi:DNA polymerase III epsilon subunit family exonuclease